MNSTLKVNMKLILYQSNKKFTLDNVYISNVEALCPILTENISELTITDPDKCNFVITSNQPEFMNIDSIEEINWQQETVN